MGLEGTTNFVMTYTFLVIVFTFILSVTIAALVLVRMSGVRPRLVPLTVYYSIIFTGLVLGYMYPVTWTAKWEEVKFFEGGVSTTKVIREEASGRKLIRFVSARDGSWHSASVDPLTRITLDGVIIPDNVEF